MEYRPERWAASRWRPRLQKSMTQQSSSQKRDDRRKRERSDEGVNGFLRKERRRGAPQSVCTSPPVPCLVHGGRTRTSDDKLGPTSRATSLVELVRGPLTRHQGTEQSWFPPESSSRLTSQRGDRINPRTSVLYRHAGNGQNARRRRCVCSYKLSTGILTDAPLLSGYSREQAESVVSLISTSLTASLEPVISAQVTRRDLVSRCRCIVCVCVRIISGFLIPGL